ncbi:transposase [Deinococcus alpinitundrae]|uniref:transposase n=1 Tax=Deinococcus alpinitundrae TaxID=468913 RepID=UPI00137B89F2|nr:transposase [Deinococcus alpinitundrae]
MPGSSSLEAKKRRVGRAIHDEQRTMQVFLALLLVHVPAGKVLMSLDRTTWEHGEAPLNLLVLGAVVHGSTLPLGWIALDPTGNSHTGARMWLVLKLLQALPARRWRGLVADRAFIGREWFHFLRRQGSRRAIRIRQDTILDELRADEWFDDVQHGEFRVIAEKAQVFGEWMRVVATRSPSGDLVIIATDFGLRETWTLYKLCWSIGCTFGSLKSRGFDLEPTGLIQPKRLERLFGLAILAWVSLLRVGIWLHEVKPIKVLAHGLKAMSLVRYGAERLRNALRWDPADLAVLFTLLTTPFSALGAA